MPQQTARPLPLVCRVPDKSRQLNRSLQHSREVYWQESENLKSFAGVSGPEVQLEEMTAGEGGSN